MKLRGLQVLIFSVSILVPTKITQKELIEPAIQGTLNVLKSCAKAKSVKRVVLTSSAAAVSMKNLEGNGHVLDEEVWSDVEFLSTVKPPTWVRRTIKLFNFKVYSHIFLLNNYFFNKF